MIPKTIGIGLSSSRPRKTGKTFGFPAAARRVIVKSLLVAVSETTAAHPQERAGAAQAARK